MPTFPTSPMWSYPVVRALAFETRVYAGKNGVEQRSMIHPGRESWTLAYERLSLAERNTLIAAYEGVNGPEQTFDFPFLGTTFANCYFDADQFTAVENAPTVIQVPSLKICQITRAADTDALPADFPALSTSGCPLQLPYTHMRTFDTVSVLTETGRSANAKRAASLRTWTAGGPAITFDEAQDIWDMFRLAGGRFRSFGFTDPDSGTRYANCRFGSDTLEWRMVGAGHNAVQVTIQELAS